MVVRRGTREVQPQSCPQPPCDGSTAALGDRKRRGRVTGVPERRDVRLLPVASH